MMPTVSEKYEAAIKAGKPISLQDAAIRAHRLEGLLSCDKYIGLKIILEDLARVDIDDDRISEVIEQPSSFGYSGGIEDMFITWSLGPVFRTRDSNLREESNADSLVAALEEAVKQGLFPSEDYEVTGCNHWAVGWVDHLSFRAIVSEEIREPTVIFMWITRWFNALEDYPVADDEDLSRREWEYALESFDYMGLDLRDELPDDWKEQVLREMTEIPSESYCQEDEAKEIAGRLGFLESEED